MRLRQFLKRWIDNERGATLPMIAISIIPVVTAIGLAVDASRGYTARAALSHALDSAALAAASVPGGGAPAEAAMNAYFQANFTEANYDISVTPVMVETGRKITVSAEISIPTTFMRVVGIDNMTVSSVAEATKELRGLELALVLDNTGSMRGQKIESLRTAAQDLVDILFDGDTQKEHLKISVIPYSYVVNVGAEAEAYVDPAGEPFDPFTPSAWKGCVMARDYPDDVLDVPSVLEWERHWWESGDDNFWPPIDPSSCFGEGPNLGCPTPILPLTGQKGDIDDALGDMEAWCRGGTFSNAGMIWGWRTLTPGAPFSQALPADTAGYDKAAVLMTDGVNQWVRNRFSSQSSDKTAYGRVHEGRLGITSTSAAGDAIDARLEEVCNNMKADDILIYTITFALDDEDTKSLFRDCATDPAKYFDSPNEQELRTAFQRIADELSNLRLSK